jgi:hypothetical protein
MESPVFDIWRIGAELTTGDPGDVESGMPKTHQAEPGLGEISRIISWIKIGKGCRRESSSTSSG